MSSGASLRKFRLRAGMTQQELAELAGVGVAGLRDLEQGRVKQPRRSTVRRLAAALELSRSELDALLDGERKNAAGLRVGVLGPLQVVVGDAVQDVGSKAQRTLLGLLALSPNLPVSRGVLVEGTWGPQPPPGAAGLLQSRVSRLRRKLRSEAEAVDLVGTPDGYRLVVAEDQHDRLAFDGLVERARRRRATGELTEAAELFSEALALWRGDPVADLPVLHSRPEVTSLLREWLVVVVEHAQVVIELGQYEQALASLWRAVETDELNEAVHATLVIALAGSGQQAAALEVYERLRRRLAEELGADPGPELAAAHQQVLRQEWARPEAAPVSAHRQLPPDISDFVGRQDELRALDEQLASAADNPNSVVITWIQGMAGAGKTKLAVHAAHRLLAAGRCSETQLHVDLHGHSDQPPADPGAVLESFLRLLGVRGSQIPAGLSERTALYRDRLFDRKALVLLDNAADEDQVLPLLPAGAGNVVLITSRRALALHGAGALPLDVFTAAEAHELLERVVGRDRIDAERAAAARVVELCGRLPLAIALVARRMQSRPLWSFADLLDRLDDSGDRLAELAAGTRKLRRVFELSYEALPTEEQRLFRLLGLHPGEDFTVHSAAALAEVTPVAARRALDHLADEHLVTSATGGRYRLHDLLGEYARFVADRDETADGRRRALGRVLDFYLHTAVAAINSVQPNKVRFELAGVPPTHGPRWTAPGEAEAWLETERACVIAAITCATDGGWSTHAWQLAHAMWSLSMLYARFEDWEHTHREGLRAAESAGDHFGQALMLAWLGGVCTLLGKYEEAQEHLDKSLALQEALDDNLEISTLAWLGQLHHRTGRYDEAAAASRRSVRLAVPLFPHREMPEIDDEYVFASNAKLERALTSYQLGRQTGDLAQEGRALVDLAEACRQLNMLHDAVDWGERGLAIALECRSRALESHARRHLSSLYRDLGRFEEAREQEALVRSLT